MAGGDVGAAVDVVALWVVAAGLVVLVLGASLGRWRDGLGVMLELWVAAGLLRLTGRPDVGRIAAAAALVAVRHLVTWGLRTGPPGGASWRPARRRPSRAADGPGPVGHTGP